ncbi:MAG: galactokinase [Acidimicrobiaceae bacterium]|nr:galactokinase [Acidimicrobiaceae bacterium]MXW77130.1 galactokinase [Acidimicrobiaceae bacterium]MYC42750.1 galactokinase [Acidimicrobiaceae bacterium]MYD06397.1 galactokinase [Acidimicrobiaceae bacterium]MYH87592.1 galactokinase [Acidimicrobiaceae bacterium]
MTKPSALDRATQQHQRRWGRAELFSRAPGRVNLIGEHTDYNDGFVLPMALPFDTAIAASRAPNGSKTEILSEGFGHAVLAPASTEIESHHWAVYLHGVHDLLKAEGVDPGPWKATIATDIPAGAGLSSSAALEVAVASAILGFAQTERSPAETARLCQRVDNEMVGIPSGPMDQMISASAVAGHASLIDCRSLQTRPHPLPERSVVAIMDTNTRRQLVDSEYSERRAACVRAAEAMGVDSLRDARLEDLDLLPTELGTERRRAHHVITENQRTLDAAQAMSDGDPETLGALMNSSHESLRDDYEVSGPALDQIVEIARQSPGCFGARLTGGGFAGCAVALVQADQAVEFQARVAQRYRTAQGLDAQIWLCEPAAGASVTTADA